MKRLLSLVLVAAGGAMIGLAAPAAAQGVVSGTVVDAVSGLPITGATVAIEGTDLRTVSDRTGRFRITAVPAGSRRLTTRYIGFRAESAGAVVADGTTVTVSFRLTPELTELGELLVTATRSGTAAALNQQMTSGHVSNVVAADQIGRFPDANLGDALKRIPGVTIGLDQGETRFGSIRGTEPRFNSVMVNGERIPSAEAEVREVQLDLIPADMVQAIEVSKTLTPDMDADAIGGSVNVITRAAPVGRRISATLGSGYNFIREKPVTLGALVMGTRFLDDRVGVIVSGSYYDQQFGSDNKEGIWNRTDGGAAYVEEFDIRRYDVQRVRRSVSGSLDWSISPDHVVMLRSIYNHRDDWENRFRIRYVLDEPDGEGLQEGEIRRQTKGGGPADRLKNARLEDQRTQSHQLSGEHLLGGRAILTWSGTIARASETRPDERYIEWRNRDLEIRPDYRDPQNPTFSPLDPSAMDAASFSFRRIEQAESFTRDLDRNVRADLLLPLSDGVNSTRVKIGARYRSKEKLRDNSYQYGSPVGSFGSLADLANSDYTTDDNLSGPYRYGRFTTPGQLAGFDLFNSSIFELEDQPGEYAAANYEATERITAGYLQIEQSLGDVTIIAGARAERTSISYHGFEFDVDEGTVRPSPVATQNYTDLLPGVNVRWIVAAGTVIRGAVTTSLARPNYYDLVPYREISFEDDELATGNPALEPTRSTNFDLSVERYFENVGLISVGVFHKEITDFIFHFTRFNAVDDATGATFRQITQPRNGPGARLTGAEIAFQRQLDFLPGLFRYLGIYANYTYNDSRIDDLAIEGRDTRNLPLLGTSKHSGNISLSLDTRRANLRVAVNYQSEALDAGEGGYSEDAFFDRWADRRTDVDVNGSFQFTPTTRFFFEANNLTNRPLRFYQGARGRVAQDEFYGRRIQAGLKFDI